MSHRVSRGRKDKPALDGKPRVSPFDGERRPPEVPDGKRPRSRKKNKLSDQNMVIHNDTKEFVRKFAEEERAADKAALERAAELLKPGRLAAGEKCE